MEIKTIQDLQKVPKKYKVLRCDEDDPKEMKAMVGGVFEAGSVYIGDKEIILLDKDKNSYWSFPASDLQEMLPYDDWKYGVGDVISHPNTGEATVYGCYWYDGQWWLLAVEDGDMDEGCYEFQEKSKEEIRLISRKGHETVDIGGKRYSLKAVEKRISGLEEVG